MKVLKMVEKKNEWMNLEEDYSCTIQAFKQLSEEKDRGRKRSKK